MNQATVTLSVKPSGSNHTVEGMAHELQRHPGVIDTKVVEDSCSGETRLDVVTASSASPHVLETLELRNPGRDITVTDNSQSGHGGCAVRDSWNEDMNAGTGEEGCSS